MAKIVTMDKIILRLSIPNNEKSTQADEFDINYDGGEANVAVSLANYGHEAEFTTAIPVNPIDEHAVTALREYSAGTKHITRSDERLGIYFPETGSAARASNAVYDRAHNSISTVTADQSNFDKILADADWSHFIGITPTISDTAIEPTRAALETVKAHNVAVPADLSFRKKLWSPEEVQKVVTSPMQYIDACIGSEEGAEKIPGSKLGNTDVTSDELELVEYVDTFNQTVNRFGFGYIINSLREGHNASDNG